MDIVSQAISHVCSLAVCVLQPTAADTTLVFAQASTGFLLSKIEIVVNFFQVYALM
jgi:hypothetical protein